MANSRLILSALLAICIASALGHSYVTSPTTRSNQKQTNTGCRGPSCLGPCDVPLSQARTKAVTIQRGASVNVQWPRNNHAGGFIRFAWAPTSGSDVHANFDANVQEIHCHEVGGCRPDDPSNPNGGDSGPADGSSRACQTTITVPLHLTDGDWTLQWAWFGGAFSLGDYYSCIDYKIQGGAVASKLDAAFIGGDYTYPGQNKCKFFNTDRLHQCVNEPCNSPLFSAAQEQAGPAYLPITNKPSSTSTSTTKASPARLTTAKINTPSVPVTTGKAASAPTSLTTGMKPVVNNGKNCAGVTTLVTSTDVEITGVDTWADVFRMEIRMRVHESVSDWMIQIVWPEDATNTEIENVYNAGTLQCSATFPNRHSMIAPVAKWANNLKAGEEMYIELRASNTNMNSQFLKANTKVTMFRK